MKILVTFLVVAAFFPDISVGQECEYKINEPDPFTNATHIETRWIKLTGWFGDVVRQTIGRNSEISVAAILEGEHRYIAMQLKLSDTTMFKPTHADVRDGIAIEKGRRLQILTMDNTEVSLYADRSVTGNTRVNVDDDIYIVKATIDARYRLDATSAVTLSSSDAVFIRVAATYNDQFELVSSDGFVDFSITAKARSEIRRVIGCLHQNHEQDFR